MEALIPLLGKIDNIGLLVSVLMNIAQGWFIVTSRREEREDKQKLLDLMNRNTEALHGLENVLSAMTGRAV